MAIDGLTSLPAIVVTLILAETVACGTTAKSVRVSSVSLNSIPSLRSMGRIEFANLALVTAALRIDLRRMEKLRENNNHWCQILAQIGEARSRFQKPRLIRPHDLALLKLQTTGRIFTGMG